MLNFSEDCIVAQYFGLDLLKFLVAQIYIYFFGKQSSSSTNMNLVKKEYFFME